MRNISLSKFYTKLAEKIATFLLPHVRPQDVTDDYAYERLKFSVDAILRDLSKFLVLALFSIPFGITHYIIVFAIGYAWLGRVTFGFHVDSSMLCMVMGLVYYLGSVGLSLWLSKLHAWGVGDTRNWIVLTFAIHVVLLLILWVVLLLYAPAETKKRPISKKRRQELKPLITERFLMLAMISLFLFFLENKTYSYLVFFSILCRAITVLPFLTYKRNIERG